MKKILPFILIFTSVSLVAQNPFLIDVNAQLRNIFSQITYPDNNVLFLYERSAKLSDSSFYQNNSPDTLDNLEWLQLYEEMYYAAHDTLPLQTLQYIQDYSTHFYGDTIPLALMDYDFYYCTEASLTTGNYFTFDTINDILYDNPNSMGSPYGRSNIFTISPLKDISDFANPVFRIDPNLFFTDNTNLSYYQNSQALRIDFGDGTGWHYFDMSQTTHYQANYSTTGQQIIYAELLDLVKNAPFKSGKSQVYTLKSDTAILPDDILNIEGMQVGIFGACNPSNEKVIIYLEGFDILDMLPSKARGLDDIYNQMIHSEYMEELRNFNYRFYVVNWLNSRIDMRFNALYLVNLIETLKNQYSASDEQFVIIGESMGGVIARYALTFMESENYSGGSFTSFFEDGIEPENILYLDQHPELYTLGQQNRNPNYVELRHKTRELITLDSPHQGANIPMSVQYAYRKAIGLIVPSYQYLATRLNLGLEGMAAKQMLLYHIDGKVNPLSSISAYEAHSAHKSFYQQLNGMGNYPINCKIVAISSGALHGTNQLNIFNHERTANDLLLDFSADLYARILWIKCPLFSASLQLRTNPDGTGTFFSTAVGSFTFHLKLKFFKIKLTQTYGNLYSDNQIGTGMKPYCISAGGNFFTNFYPDSIINPGSYSLSSNWLFNLFSFQVIATNNCNILNAHIGWQGLSSTNFDMSICSEGTTFSFIPLQSALDYGNGLNFSLDHDLYNENISTKLSRTPFDVIIGYPYSYNHEHLNYRDELIYNLTGQASTNCYTPFDNSSSKIYYDADLASMCEVKRSFLCLEIGDEELYLENWDLNRPASFQAEYDLYVNKRNPYYTYLSQNSIFNMYGIYSKESSFQITSTGFANFISNGAGSPTGSGFTYASPQAASGYWSSLVDVPMPVCIKDYALGKKMPVSENSIVDQEAVKLLIYPNPNDGSLLTFKHTMTGESPVTVIIADMTGKIIYSETLSAQETSTSISLSGFSAGLYLVHVKNKEQQVVSSRLIIE